VTPDPVAVVRFLYALSDGTCLRIVEHLAGGPAHTTAVAAALGVSVSNVSNHLINLRTAGVLASERDRVLVLYRLVGGEVADGRLTLRRPGVTLVMVLDAKGEKKPKGK
jgi:DNA-binding transcriptional ArsR family regulator